MENITLSLLKISLSKIKFRKFAPRVISKHTIYLVKKRSRLYITIYISVYFNIFQYMSQLGFYTALNGDIYL